MAKDKSVSARTRTVHEQQDSGHSQEAQHGGPTEHREPKHKPGDKPSSQGQSRPLKS
jgi:hypothetical protein